MIDQLTYIITQLSILDEIYNAGNMGRTYMNILKKIRELSALKDQIENDRIKHKYAAYVHRGKLFYNFYGKSNKSEWFTTLDSCLN